VKPNDARALNLMNAAATHVVTTIADLVVAYGVSDEYSFVFHRSTDLFERRAAKLVSTVVSTFTAAYVALWSQAFADPGAGHDEGPGGDGGGATAPSLSLDMLPTFDGRAVCYPSWENLRDYLSWRQVDCTSTLASSSTSFLVFV
jgi:tRNA(His) guanylyltransferase